MADEVEDVLEQARQKLVEIVRLMMRFMDRHSGRDSQLFRGLVEQEAPGMPAMIDQGHTASDISRTLAAGWDGTLTQAFRGIPPDHPVFRDPAVQAANDEYFRLRPQVTQRRDQLLAQLQQLGAPVAAPEFQRPTLDPNARTAAAAPLGRPAPAPARTPVGQVPPRPAQPPTPQARTGQPPVPGTQPTPPATPTPGVRAPAPAVAPQTRAPGAGPTPPRTQAPGTAQTPGATPTPPRTQAAGVTRTPATGAPTPAPGVGQVAATSAPAPPRTQAAGVTQTPAASAPTPPTPAPGVGDAQPASGQVGEGTSRTITAGTSGPVKLDAGLLGAAGRVVVRADPNCTEARITIRTADQTGPAADAVRDATLESSPDGRVTASAQQTQPGISIQGGPQPGAGNIIGDAYVVHHGNVGSSYYTNSPNGFSVVSQSGSGAIINGSLNNVSFDNGRIQIGSINGGAFTIGPQTAPIEIEAIVPEGSSIDCTTDRANLETHGRVDVVEANSAAGNVSVDSANQVQAQTASGDVSVRDATEARATTASGNVSVGNATSVRATTASGDVSVRNADTVRATTASGDVRVDSSKDVNARTANGDVDLRDVRGSARASSGTGAVSVHATEGGTVTAGSALGRVDVTATDKAVNDGLTVKAEGPPGQVRTPEGANTGTSAAAGSSGAREFNDTNRADRARDTGTGRG